jgi:hypothetical protein
VCRYDEEANTLWMLDWGGFITLQRHERRGMCELIVAVDDYCNGAGDKERHVELIKRRCGAPTHAMTKLRIVTNQGA